MKPILRTALLSITTVLLWTTTGFTQPTPPVRTPPARAHAVAATGTYDSREAVAQSTKAVLATITDTDCKNIQSKPFPSELHYYHTFHPTDTLFDCWCKVQAIKGSGPAKIIFTMKTDEHSEPMGSFKVAMDGIPHVSKSDFADAFVSQAVAYAASRDGVYYRRAVKKLKDVGVPIDAPGADYSFFNGDFVFKLDSVEIMGIPFTLEATYSANLGLMVPKLEGKPVTYPEFEANKILTGFPLSVSDIDLVSLDSRIKDAAPEIINTITAKYAKYVKGKRVADKDDSTHFKTTIADDNMSIFIHEGLEKGKPYLQIHYVPRNASSNHVIAQGEKSFSAAVLKVKEDTKKALLEKMKSKKDQNTPF